MLGKRKLRIPDEYVDLYYKIHPDLTVTLEEELDYDDITLEHDMFEDYISIRIPKYDLFY